jgi:hypothetical protein
VEDEPVVDLELVDRDMLEPAERRVARAEVVDRETDAEVAQAREHADRALGADEHAARAPHRTAAPA